MTQSRYVNHFSRDKAKAWTTWKEDENRADGEGVTSVLNSCAHGRKCFGAALRGQKRNVKSQKMGWGSQILGVCFRVKFLSAGTLIPPARIAEQESDQCLLARSRQLLRVCRWDSASGRIIRIMWLLPAMAICFAEMIKQKLALSGLERLPDFGNFVMTREGGRWIATILPEGWMRLMLAAKGVRWADRLWDDRGNWTQSGHTEWWKSYFHMASWHVGNTSLGIQMARIGKVSRDPSQFIDSSDEPLTNEKGIRLETGCRLGSLFT